MVDGGRPKSYTTYLNDIEPTIQFDRFNSCDWCVSAICLMLTIVTMSVSASESHYSNEKKMN